MASENDYYSEKIFPIVNPLKELLKDFELRESQGAKEFIGYSIISLPEFNKAMSGLRKGTLSVFAAPPGCGKAAFLLEIAISVIRSSKIPVLYLSFEDSIRSLIYQILSLEAGMDQDTLLFKKIMSVPERKEKLKTALSNIAKFQSYLHIVSGSAYDTVTQISQLVESMKMRYNVREVALFIDSLQRIPTTDSNLSYKDSTERCANDLKLLAMSADIPVFVTSQVNSAAIEINSRECADKIYFSQCRGSEELIQYADFALVASQNHNDNKELCNQLRNRAESLGKDKDNLPNMKVIDLQFEDALGNFRDAVQFLYDKDTGGVIELGLYSTQDMTRHNRLDRVLNELLAAGRIYFHEPDILATQTLGGAVGTAAQAVAATAQQDKPKISIKLKP